MQASIDPGGDLTTADEPARVHGPMGIEGRLDPFGDRPVGPRLAPDARGAPSTRSGSGTGSGCRRRAAPCRRSFAICSGRRLQGPLAQGVGADDPVAGVRLDRPSLRVEALDERRDRRRTEVGHEADRPDSQRLELGRAPPRAAPRRPLEDRRGRSRPSSLFSRSICQRTDAALSSKPMARTP